MGLDYVGFWQKFLLNNIVSEEWTRIERINIYILFCDELIYGLEILYAAVIENNRIYSEVVLEQKLNLNDDLKKKGFFTVYYVDNLGRLLSVKLSLYDCCYWLVLRNYNYNKVPNDLNNSNLNFDFVSNNIQNLLMNLFNYIWYVNYFLKKNNEYFRKTKLDFNNPRLLNELNELNFSDIILGNSFDLVSWFFFVNTLNIDVEKLNESEFYIKDIIFLQKSYNIFVEIDDNNLRFEAYKNILISLIKLSEFTKKKFVNIKNNDDSLKTWKEWVQFEINKFKFFFKID